MICYAGVTDGERRRKGVGSLIALYLYGGVPMGGQKGRIPAPSDQESSPDCRECVGA